MEDMAGLQLSPLQLNKYFIKELHYAVKDDFDDKYDQAAAFPYPQLTAMVKHVKGGQTQRDWRFELTLESEDSRSEEFPYSLKIVLVGYFTVLEEYPNEKAELLANVNGPSLLYSAAREALVTITGRSGYPAIVLPSVIFVQHALNVSGAMHKSPTAAKAGTAQKSDAGDLTGTNGQSKSRKKTSKKESKTS